MPNRKQTIAFGDVGLGFLRQSIVKSLSSILWLVAFLGSNNALTGEPPSITFYKDVLPILEQHCQSCHRPKEIAPFSLVTYAQTKNWAGAIRADVQTRKMPPWFADPCCGHFSNNPSLSEKQVQAVVDWVADGMPAGNPSASPTEPRWTDGWNIAPPDLVLKMPGPVKLPANGD